MEEKPWRESIEFGSRADSKYLADLKESCGFLRDLLIRRNLADYVSSADSMSSSRGTDDDCRLSRVIYPKESSSNVQAYREAGRGISIEIRWETDEEKRVASEGGVEECPGVMQLDPGVASSIVQSGRSSRLLESRRRERERDDVEQKVALALRCDDAKMSLVVRRNEKVCAVFTDKC